MMPRLRDLGKWGHSRPNSVDGDVTRLSDEAFVLRTQELGENDLIVSLFTREHGKVRGVARAARKSRRRFGGTLEPLTFVRVAWTEKPQRDLHRLDSTECIRSYAAMQSDPRIQAVCAVLSEVSESFAHEGQADEKAFKLIGAVLGALEAGADPWVIVRYFEYWMLRVHGLLPDLESCSGCGSSVGSSPRPRVDSNGDVRCRDCAQREAGQGRTIGAAEISFLDATRRQPPDRVEARSKTVGPGSPLEFLLRGTLESFVERRFRTYHHLRAATVRADGEIGAR
jgi:DNA repair protein RecO (recombination protein O)